MCEEESEDLGGRALDQVPSDTFRTVLFRKVYSTRATSEQGGMMLPCVGVTIPAEVL